MILRGVGKSANRRVLVPDLTPVSRQVEQHLSLRSRAVLKAIAVLSHTVIIYASRPLKAITWRKGHAPATVNVRLVPQYGQQGSLARKTSLQTGIRTQWTMDGVYAALLAFFITLVRCCAHRGCAMCFDIFPSSPHVIQGMQTATAKILLLSQSVLTRRE